MDNENLSDVLAFASVLSVFVLSLVQLVKTTFNPPKRIIPLIGVIIGLFIGWISIPFTGLDLVLRLWSGGLAGLSATGLFELAFNNRSVRNKK